MADYDSSLPIRTEADGTDERLHSKLVDYTDPGGTDKQLEISEKKAHVRNHSKDSDGNDQEQLLSQEGHSLTNGDYDATNNKRPSSQGLIASDRSASPAETTMNKRPTAISGEADSVCIDIAMHDGDGQKYDEDNPLAVYMAESPADEVDEFDEAVDIAKDALDNHDYTVTAAKTFKSIEAEGSASGKARFELQIETGVATGIFTTAMVKFNSTSKSDVSFKYSKGVGAGIRVRLEKTNLDNQAQSLYSQIRGLEI
jgi:hypothetical protein